MSRLQPSAHGPFSADQIRSGDPYELSHGHPFRCLPSTGRRANTLYDWQQAEQVTLRNLLQKQGYSDIEAVLDAGRAEGREEGNLEGRRAALLELCEDRGLTMTDEQHRQMLACTELERLKHRFQLALKASATDEIFRA
jgi:hypothetical protein